MNQIRTLRLKGEDREKYVRDALSGMSVQRLRHIMAESGVPDVNKMRKEQMVEEATKFVLQWADKAEVLDELHSRSVWR